MADNPLQRTLQRLLKRKESLEEEVFMAPPKTMEEFSQRLGRWLEVNELLDEIAPALRGEEDDEGDPHG